MGPSYLKARDAGTAHVRITAGWHEHKVRIFMLAQEFAQKFGLRIVGALIQLNQDAQPVPRLPDFQCARVV